MNLFDIYESGAVKRYHGKRTYTNQTVADHAWGVAAVMLWIYYPEFPPLEKLQRALFHDAPELITGDTPAPAKWRSPELKAILEKLEREIANDMGIPVYEHDDPLQDFCDNAELVMHCVAQAKMGNTFFIQTANKGLDKIDHIIKYMPEGRTRIRAMELYSQLSVEVLNVR